MTLRALRRFGAGPLVALLALAGACEDNGFLFSEVHPLAPGVVQEDAGVAPGDAPSTEPSSTPPPGGSGSGAPNTPGAGGSSGAAAGSGAPGSGAPGSGAAGAAAGDAGAAPLGGGVGAGPNGYDPGGGGSGAAAPGTGGGAVNEPPRNDNSCGNQCTRRGGRCQEGTCIFDCTEPGSCSEEQVLCPTGRPCEVRCGDRACARGVVCDPLGQCDVRCEGAGSCAEQVICEGRCEIGCSGPYSCASGIGGPVVSLELECSGVGSCSSVSCEGQDCQIECTGAGSCSRVRSIGDSNDVSCSGSRTCSEDVLCLGGTCDVSCAYSACTSGVDCRALDCYYD